MKTFVRAHQSLTMEQSSNMYIPFQIKIEAGEAKFTIPLPRDRIKDGYIFYFKTLTLKTDLYSKQAQIMGFDSIQEQEFQYTYPFRLEYNFGPDYYPTGNNANKWIQEPKTQNDHNTTLKNINEFFDALKPAGSVYPPVIFDWSLLTGMESGMDLNTFHAEKVKFLYNVEVDEPRHHNWLPPGAKKPGLNNWMFPTNMSDPRVSKSTYIRMHLAPNAEIGFSNEALLIAFGFSANQYEAKKGANAQIKFFNPDPCKYLTIVAENPVGPMISSINNKITVYWHQKKMTSCEGHLTTKRGNLVKPDKLAEDYNKGFKDLANQCNQTLGLEYKEATKTFAFTYPNAPDLKTEVLLPSVVSEQLGFPRGTTRIPQSLAASPLNWVKDISDFVKSSVAIVYDVGLATVYLDDEINYQTMQFGNKVMATLEPMEDGTMRMMCNTGDDVATAFLSYLARPQLDFTIARFSEASKPVPLSLPVGAYISGQLVGKKV